MSLGWWIALIALELLGLITAIYAVLWARTAQGATAWAVGLILMPPLALPAFVVFGGRKFQGYVDRRRTSDARLKKEWREFAEFFRATRCFKDHRSPTIQAFERLAETPFAYADKVQLLKNGDEFFPMMMDVIRDAKEFLDIQFYTVRNDQIGTEIAELLKEKARRGVKVRLLYDSVGSHETPRRFFQDLRAAGVRAEAFISTRWRWHKPRFQVNFRNHRKMVNADNRRLLVGGMNLGDEYLSRNPKIGFWRDTGILIEGCVVPQAHFSFLSDWYWSTSSVIDFKPENACQAPQKGIPALILATGPTGLPEKGALAVLNAIHSAERRLWITSPYFVPDEQIISALQLAAMRGVDVKILVTDKTDNLLPQLASYTFYDELLPFGIEVHKYTRGLMHQKVMLVDDGLVYVGSTNFDNRSFRLNFEMGAWFCDENLAGEIEDMLRADFRQCELLELNQIQSMPLGRRLSSGFARLLAPVL